MLALMSISSKEIVNETPNTTNEQPKNTCVQILRSAVQNLENFQEILQRICTTWENIQIKHIVSLFPEIRQAEHDLRLLQPLLDVTALPQLLCIVSYWRDRQRIQDTCMGCINLSEKISANIDSTLLRNAREIDEQTTGEQCASVYAQFRDQILQRYPENVLTLISHYSSSADLFDFLHLLTPEDVYNLKEAVNDWEETLVSTRIVFDLAVVKNFIDLAYENMRAKRNQAGDTSFQLENMVTCFTEVWKNNQFIDLIKCLESSSLALSSIKRIHLELTDKEQSKRRRIADILQNSSVAFVRIGDHHPTFDVKVKLPTQKIAATDENKQQHIVFADLSELRDRARLLEYSSNVKKQNASEDEIEHDKQKLRVFIGFASIVESTLEILSTLFTAGHPSVSEFLAPRMKFSCIDGVYDDLQQNNRALNDLLNDWEKNLCSMYEKYVGLTYFSGDQFWLIEDYIYDRPSFSHAGYHLLKFIDLDPSCIVQPQRQKETPVDRLANLGLRLSKQLSFSSVEKAGVLKKCLLIETTNEGILRAILSLFSMTSTTPRVHHIFYCTPRTTWIQLRGFVYRCFYSESFHQLVRPELLSQSIQDQFVHLVRSLVDHRSVQHFQMGIITTITPADQQMINGLQSMQVLHILRDHELLNVDCFQKSITSLIRNCTRVTSRIAGLGKSSTIRQTIRRSGRQYVKFPIHGDFDADTLAERLCMKYTELRAGAIHLDIGAVENMQQLNEVLYCLLLFRSFQFGQVAVSLPAEVPVYIELDASPQYILTEGTVLNHIEQCKHIDQVHWRALNAGSDEIQAVANYLRAIANDIIVKQNVDAATFEHIDMETCSRLIQTPFLENKNTEYITWTQLSIFIAVFHRLFNGFSRCGYFLREFLPQPQLRMELVQTLLRSSNQFTSLSVEAVRKQQRSVVTDEIVAFSDAIVRWDKIQPFTLVFTSTDDPIFVYKKPSDVPRALVQYLKIYHQNARRSKQISETELFPDYDTLNHTEFFMKLASLSKKYLNKAICPTCFGQYDFKEQKCQKCVTKDILIRPKTFLQDDLSIFQMDIAARLQKEYVLTPDNFIKMLLIYMRVQSGIPVLIMGETGKRISSEKLARIQNRFLGCGKTALIQFLCQKILDDELRVFRVHAGVKADRIIEMMRRYIADSEECTKQGKRLWIFFDEFNTTSNIGLLKEIICDRTLLGAPLPTNLVFLGACNPRRNKTGKVVINDDAHIGLRKNRYDMQKMLWAGTGRLLLYTVVPIPETMLEYIWDYGYLNESTEKVYIKTMMQTCRDLSSDPALFRLTAELLVSSQNHFRDLEDASSVSLRDIARFCRLYNWFLDSLQQRARDGTANENSAIFPRRATLTALLLCYYFRLRSVALQKVYTSKMQSIMMKDNPRLKKVPDYLTKYILEVEQKKLIDDKMELPMGTASNRALRDNIFVLFACMVNRIPLLLCGKPGSSKSSAVQIIISNLKGKKSKDPYFQTLPELVAVSFQGSQNCTSESIIKVFQRAENYSRVKSRSELLPVIVFDEIGLAELSPHNPLKVLHAELEVENNQYGFVGISNWRLDASKMNRALYLSTPDPDVKDLQLTGRAIASSMQEQVENQVILLEPLIIESLSEAYHALYKNLQETQADYENYFGLRDYYSLIKGIIRDTTKLKEKADIYAIVRTQLKVNFDGILDGSLLLWQHFCQHMNRQNLFNDYDCPTFNVLLDQALNSRAGRYLMLIADSESTIDYVERVINTHQKSHKMEVRTLVGSSFPGDLLSGNTYAEQYNYRVLMDIILYAERNITLIMRQMGHVYDNLYDLFNQNFAVSARKKYCRIALGALYHPRCLVNDDFYCVVFIHRRDLDKCDPPFLNRFEKHKIDVQALIHPRYRSICSDLHLWLHNLMPDGVGKHFPLIQHLFVNYSQDQICDLVIETFEQLQIPVDSEEGDDEHQIIVEKCKENLLCTSSFDLPLVLSIRPTDGNQILIDKYYNIHELASFSKLLAQALAERQIHPRIIYTYTQIFHPIETLSHGLEEIKLSAFKTELELTNKIKRHYQVATDVRLLLIRVDYHHEHQHILSLKHVVLNERVSESDRGVWLVFHLQRNLLNQTSNDVLFSKWAVNMIDDLNDRVMFPKTVFTNPSYQDLVLQPEYHLSECLFNDLVDRCLSKFRYIVSRKTDEVRINARRHMIFQHIIEPSDRPRSSGFSLRSIVENNLILLVGQIERNGITRFLDWRLDLLTNGKIIAGSRSFQDAFQSTSSTFYEAHLLLLLAHLEKHSFLDAYTYISSIDDKNIQDSLHGLWMSCFTSSMEKIDSMIIDREIIEVKLVFDLKLPCAAAEYEKIRFIRDKIQELQDSNDVDSDNSNFAINQIFTTSVYGEDFMQLVMNDPQRFELYFHDQVAMHLLETNIHLSTHFVFGLLTSNTTRSLAQKVQLLLSEHLELTKILRLFEIGLQMIQEEELGREIEKQWINDSNNLIRSSQLYTLIFANGRFYQLPPRETIIEDAWAFSCRGDPMIETSLMNLVELVLSPSIIEQANGIEQITTTYSLIAQGVRDLPSYQINNLEKLRSFISLIRCLTTLLPERALDVFKGVCKQGFDGTFDSCQSVHQFITNLRELICHERSTGKETAIDRTLVKLEVEFLKDWLADHRDSYGEILMLLDENNNDLWHYSAKIFTYIDRKLDFFSTLKANNGRLPSIPAFEELNNSLQTTRAGLLKVERLMVNRLHMHLMKDARGDEIEQRLTNQYTYFEQNLYAVQNIQQGIDATMISLLAWLKYYSQIYGFALANESREPILHRIDQLLTNISTPFCSTLKLFIFKQLLQTSRLGLNDLRDVFINRNITWIKPFIQRPRDQQAQHIRRHLILPTPLFECRKQFIRVSEILNEVHKIDELRQLIHDCSTSQQFSYAFLCWFIQYYCRFIEQNVETDVAFVQLLERDLGQDLIRTFTPLGHRLLIGLCSNFSENSFFHLHPAMAPIDIHQRLLALSIVAVFVSFKSRREITFFANILFNEQRQMPNNYLQHLSAICLPGLTVSDPVITQMIDVRAQAQDRLKRGVIHAGGRFIFQCARDCLWMFIFHDCGVPNDRNVCPICRKPIGAARYNVLIERDPPQIQRPIEEGLRIINEHIDRFNRTARLGYHNVKPADTSIIGEKPDHLNRPVSFRFVHLLTHGLLLFLHDLNFLTKEDLINRLHLPTVTHFCEHFAKDYALLTQTSTDDQQCYIWLYKLLNHLVNDEFANVGSLKTNEMVLQFEQMLEQKLIFTHIDSIANEIVEYRHAYAHFIQERDAQPSLESFVDELFEDQQQYPLLNFFNITTFYTSNPLDEFMLKIQTIPYAEQTYPVTSFLLKRLNDYVNIQHLYPIVVFTNYLIDKFNHRIKRNNAAETKLLYYLTTGDDQHVTKQLFDAFLHAWYSLNLKEVRYGCQAPKFEMIVSKEKFAESTSVATLLLNTSRDDSSLLVAACLKTVAELQNEIVSYFHNTVEHTIGIDTKQKRVPLQSIRPEHILRLDRNDLSKKLVDDSLVLNYQYGKSRDVIYDYEEIEITLRNIIGSLVLIDTEQLRFLNYQFELYGENTSLINDVRARIKQKHLPYGDRTKLHSLLIGMNHDDLLHYLGSLDYVFTYLRTAAPENASETTPIQTSVEHHIHSHNCLNGNVLRRPPFSMIQLQYIIDLYEMLEEIAFDKVLRTYVKKELIEETFSDEERQHIVAGFSRETYEKPTVAPALNTIDAWISMLKRLMIRVLNANVSLAVPLQLYLERTDLWTDRVTDADLASFQVEDEILLQHTYVILCGLERKQQGSNKSPSQTNIPEIQSTEGQRQKVQAWFDEAAKPTTTPKVVTDNKPKKLRV